MIRIALACIVLAMTIGFAEAHSWYSHKSDPVAGSCCSGIDCGMWAIEPGQITSEGEGYRVRMTREQVLKANPESDIPYIDQYFPESRVIDSEDGNWHACPKFAGSPSDGLRCLMRPPNG